MRLDFSKNNGLPLFLFLSTNLDLNLFFTPKNWFKVLGLKSDTKLSKLTLPDSFLFKLSISYEKDIISLDFKLILSSSFSNKFFDRAEQIILGSHWVANLIYYSKIIYTFIKS